MISFHLMSSNHFTLYLSNNHSNQLIVQIIRHQFNNDGRHHMLFHIFHFLSLLKHSEVFQSETMYHNRIKKYISEIQNTAILFSSLS